ncbi:MAG TPA: hypothetical protein VLJ16_07720, partial [Acidobacteriota bacterium]|nr:hypothetical protein [Acidobacteriota bacterium]
MFRTVLRRELLHNLYSLRFLISLALLLAVFAAGAVSFVRSQSAALDKYRETHGAYLGNMRALAAENATQLAVRRQTFTLRPRATGFISDAQERYLPNAIVFS